MTPIEIMALIIAVAAAIKILVILVSPKLWVNLVKKVWFSPLLIGILSLVLAIISLYYLIQAGITIVQIFAVMLFISLLAAVGVAVYSKEVVGIAVKLLKDRNILKKAWFYIIIWIVLLIWVLKELIYVKL